MDLTIINSYDNALEVYEKEWVKKIYENAALRYNYSNPTATLYTSMVYGFANHLPYSIDIEQSEYVPADFLNMVPLDFETNSWFKWEDRRTMFKSMVNWEDTFKNGMLLQVCYVFQKMILGQFPCDYELTDIEYYNWGIHNMTKDEEYNRCFFETLRSLPNYYNRVMNAVDNEERRKVLEEFYNEVMQKISAKFGVYRETDTKGKVIRSFEGKIILRPSKDVSLLANCGCIQFYDGITEVTKVIKEGQLIYYKNKNVQRKLVQPNDKLDK